MNRINGLMLPRLMAVADGIRHHVMEWC